jgi:hypothetical protein
MPATKKPGRRTPTPASHYCDWDAPGDRLVRALCGTLIRRRDHANAPTCATCQAVLIEREAEEATP